MYISKSFFGITVSLRTQRLVHITLVNISYDRFFGHDFTLCVCNLKLSIHYVSKKQKKAYADMMESISNMPEDW